MSEYGDGLAEYARAHAMSPPQAVAPERQHMSKAAREAHSSYDLHVSHSVFEAAGTVLLTVAEHDALLSRGAFDERSVRAIEAELAARTDAWEGIEFGLREENRKLRIENGRLRKEVMPNANDPAEIVGQHAVAGAASAKTRALLTVAQADHRQGIPQPEGEPVAPMSGRGWRWMP